MSYTENSDAHAPRLASVGGTGLLGNPVTGDTIVVNLPLTDEEIEAKVAELVDREFRELIEASGIETNLRLLGKPTAHLAS